MDNTEPLVSYITSMYFSYTVSLLLLYGLIISFDNKYYVQNVLLLQRTRKRNYHSKQKCKRLVICYSLKQREGTIARVEEPGAEAAAITLKRSARLVL